MKCLKYPSFVSQTTFISGCLKSIGYRDPSQRWTQALDANGVVCEKYLDLLNLIKVMDLSAGEWCQIDNADIS